MAFADNTKILMFDGTERYARVISEGDLLRAYNSEEPATVTRVEKGYNETFAVLCTDKGEKKALYCTTYQVLLNADGETVRVDNLRLGTMLANVGKVIGAIESGERQTYKIITDNGQMIFANGFIGG